MSFFQLRFLQFSSFNITFDKNDWESNFIICYDFLSIVLSQSQDQSCGFDKLTQVKWSFSYKVILVWWPKLWVWWIDSSCFLCSFFNWFIFLISSVAGCAATSSETTKLYRASWWGVVLDRFLDLIIKLWLIFRSRHIVLWSLKIYGLRESR